MIDRRIDVTLSVNIDGTNADFAFSVDANGIQNGAAFALILAQRAVDAYSGAYGLGE